MLRGLNPERKLNKEIQKYHSCEEKKSAPILSNESISDQAQELYFKSMEETSLDDFQIQLLEDMKCY